LKPGVDRTSNGRVNDVLEIASGDRVGKDNRPELAAVEGARIIKHFPTETPDDGVKPGGANGDDIASQRVGVDGGDTEPLELNTNVALARCDAARERDTTHKSTTNHLLPTTNCPLPTDPAPP
jgi:hypothetical protein